MSYLPKTESTNTDGTYQLCYLADYEKIERKQRLFLKLWWDSHEELPENAEVLMILCLHHPAVTLLKRTSEANIVYNAFPNSKKVMKLQQKVWRSPALWR